MRWALIGLALIGLAGAGPARIGQPGEGAGEKGAQGEKGQGKGAAMMAEAQGRGRMVEMLKGGMPQAQVIAWRKELKADPGNLQAQAEIAVALSKLGRCLEVLDWLWPLVGEPVFGAREALVAAQCSDRLRLRADAIYFDRLALEMDRESVRGWTQLALHAGKVGDEAAVAEALDALERQSKGGDPAIYARASLALWRGDLDALSVDLAIWERAGWEERDAIQIGAQLWLDLDDPVEALATATTLQASRMPGRHPFAEAYRRLGELSSAEYVLENRASKPSVGPHSDAIRARVKVDRGDLDGAAKILDGYLDSEEPDILASRWYLAREGGDAAAMARLEAAWRQAREVPMQSLDQLIPLPARSQ